MAEAAHPLVQLDLRDCRVSLPSGRALFPKLAVFNTRRYFGSARKPGEGGVLGLAEAMCAKGCSFTETGSKYSIQDSFHCLTCRIVGRFGICGACAMTCHAGHEIAYNGRGDFFCDCPLLKP
mmetsp:Transcript_39879/g.62202  ORF Transcript_39879/g.62202 Transcript_39879/m.62202 type:complete len:122 (-) Transcript_39879:385-750(-)